MTTTESALAAGSAAPDLEIESAAGVPIRLATLWGARPIALAFIGEANTAVTAQRAAQVRDAQAAMEQFGVLPVCVLSGSEHDANALARELRLVFPLLCDTERAAAAAFGVAAGQPALFVIDSMGRVRRASAGSGELELPTSQELAEAGAGGATAAARMAGNGGGQPFVPPGPGSSAFVCAKCGNESYEITTLSTAGGWLSRLFNFQYRKFSAVSCAGCSYTELYKRTSGALSNIADILAGS